MSGDRSTEYNFSGFAGTNVAAGTILLSPLYVNPDPTRLDYIFVTALDISFSALGNVNPAASIDLNGVPILTAAGVINNGTINPVRLCGINWRIRVAGGATLRLVNINNVVGGVNFNWTYYVAR